MKIKNSKLKINSRYFPHKIEAKWQEKWASDKIYEFKSDSSKEKYYNLVELPYPSGDLHLGHWFAFVPPDAHARYMRMNGKNVLFPNGFDAFGLPAENAAIKRDIHPKDWTMKNIETMRGQFETMGTMIDWTHTTKTCLPDYYRWNQWIFLKMFEKGIAYRGKALSNWCPKDQTVLANEHIESGKCWRCGEVVEQKEVEQWFLKITDFADKLLWENTDEKISNGVDWPKSVREAQNNWIGRKDGIKIKHEVVGTDLSFETFSAFPAWLWADSFIVIAPEHPLVKELVKGTDSEKEVLEFVDEMSKETELERKETTEKKGVFTGRYAKDPFGGKDMPIWLANFALLNFGTGIIRCSSHDPRDFEFATKYKLDLKEVVDRYNDQPANAHDNKGVLKDSGPFSGRKVSEVREEVLDWIEKEGIGVRFVNYHLHDWSISRQRYWGTPVPIIHCEKDGDVPVPFDQLPVEIPYEVDYTPQGKPPLASAEDWLNVECPVCHGPAKRDAETLDTFFDSAWYYYRYVSPHFEEGPFDSELVKASMPVNVYFGGGEHTLGHTLYARFFTKFFKELGLVDFDEFALKRVQHGVILGPDGNRMSKSKGNVVNPDDVVREYGADTVRLYLCFMMPYEATAPWSVGAISGIFRFLKRVWDLQNSLGENIELNSEDEYWLNKTVKKVGEDLEEIHFNTAVSTLMEWLNYLSSKKEISNLEYKTFLKLLAPFAPHITEEIWSQIDDEFPVSSIHLESWPEFNQAKIVQDEVNIAVQINGKVRGAIKVESSKIESQSDIEEIVKNDQNISKYLGGQQIKKIIYIKGKIISFVI